MTESRAPYILTPADPLPLPRPCTLEPFGWLYCQPSPQDVRAVKALLGMSGAQIANLVGVDARAVRRWLAVAPAAHAPVPYAAWRLMLMAAGLVPMQKETPP